MHIKCILLDMIHNVYHIQTFLENVRLNTVNFMSHKLLVLTNQLFYHHKITKKRI